MSKTEITAETLIDIIKAAGFSPRDFDIFATLKRVARYDRDMAREIADGGHPDDFGPVDLETVVEWLDEAGRNTTTYVLSDWMAAA